MKTNEEVPMQLSEDDVACCVCYVPYNDEKQFPLKICSNKHVVCNKCLWAMFIEPGVEFSCPFCKQIIEKKSRCVIHPNNLKRLQENMAKSRVVSEKSSINEISGKVKDLSLHEKVEIDPNLIFEKEVLKPVEKSGIKKPIKTFESEKKVIVHSNGEKKPGHAMPAQRQTNKVEQPRAHSQSYNKNGRPAANKLMCQNESMRINKKEDKEGKDNTSTTFAYEKMVYK